MNFRNEPLSDFSQPAARESLERALVEVRKQLGHSYALHIGGKRVQARKVVRSINPSRMNEIVGVVPEADRALADRALDAAQRAFETWSSTGVEQRTALLRRMAARLRERKPEFTAWLIFEVGKNAAEADADVAEAVDFLEYYAELALLPPTILTPVRGERNEYRFLPLGPVVVIPPWNFPLAILVGMTAAAVVAGNTVVLKPSSQSPVIAAQFMALAEEAGVPPGVINLVSGSGAVLGDYLVKDPRTRMIAFTGSREIGLHINALAAAPAKGPLWIKRVIAEMGGKNAIVIDESAALDEAVAGVWRSAFGYQGQKCSACSRVYVHAGIYDAFVERLRQQVQAITLGPADVFGNFMGPVVSRASQTKILKMIAKGRRRGRLLTGGAAVRPKEGFYIQPTVFERLPWSSPIWSQEIFGPVVALAKVASFEEGLERANDSEYGLTGAVYSADPAHLDKARHEFFCGNLYLNRKCTGALVGGHPFGGFNMSGTDSKAGGPDYLALFQQAKVVSEKI
jgi:1-pyrroline-5-carboxylate dehydrogenase